MESALITKNNDSQTIQLADAVFNCDFNESLIHQVICAYSAGSRQGTHAQKTRGEVSGGGKKPWKQKGTGRARAGSIRSPIWRGGGATFAVKPRDYSQKVNKKMYRGAMRSILSKLLEEKRLIISETLVIEEPKTKAFTQLLKKLNVERALVVLDGLNENLYLAARNVPNIKLCFPQQVNPVDLVKYPHTVITVSALKILEEGLL